MSLKYGFDYMELIKTGRTTIENINEMCIWLKTTNLPEIQNEQIGLFLLSCENDQANTKKTILAYFKMRHLAPEFFTNCHMDADDIKQIINVVDLAISPCLTPDGNALLMGRLTSTSHWSLRLAHAIKLFCMCQETVLHGSPPRGLVIVLDFRGIGIMHLTCLRVGVCRKFLEYLQEGMPLQLRQIHILNTVSFFDKILAIVKPFLSRHVLQMIQTHPPGMDMEDFFSNWVPASCMPRDYGGTLPEHALLAQKTYESVKNLHVYFREEEELIEHYGMMKRKN